ncbi:MAG TPA: TorF family putative porin [Oleiagrimonas sp.]|nr:TorF family putative porin [Oleiagrimonas sp.]
MKQLHRSSGRAAIFGSTVTALAIGMSLMPSTAARAAELSGSASLTSDYVWRGTSQTHGNAAFQAGFAVGGASGFYASVWGSNIDFGPGTDARAELDTAVGWSHALGRDWALDVSVLHYAYPGSDADLDWTELDGTLTWRDNYWASLGWSPEALGSDSSGTYALVGAAFPVADRFRIEATLGHYFLDDVAFADDGYTDAALSAIWAFSGPFEARLSAHATSSSARTIFGDEIAGSRIEAALQASF